MHMIVLVIISEAFTSELLKYFNEWFSRYRYQIVGSKQTIIIDSMIFVSQNPSPKKM